MDNVQAGGLSYRLDADAAPFAAAMKKAEGSAKAAGDAMGKSFEDASKTAEKSVDSFSSRMIDGTVKAITSLQGINNTLGALWSSGADGAEKAVTDGFNKMFGGIEGGLTALVGKIPGIWGKIGAGVLAVLQGSGALGGAFEWMKKKAASLGDDMLDAFNVSGAPQKLRDGFAALASGANASGNALGLFDEAQLKKNEEAINGWADGVKSKLDDLATGAQTALQKLAGTFKGVSDEVKAAIEVLEKHIEKQEQANELIGKDAGERAAIQAKIALIEKAGKAWDDFNEKEVEAAEAAIANARAAAALGEEWREQDRDAKDRARTIEQITQSLQRQSLMEAETADRINKSAAARAIERAQAQAQGTGRKSSVADDPEVQAAIAQRGRDAAASASKKFNTDLDETVRKQTEGYQLQTASLGANVAASTAMKLRQEEENAARRDGVILTEEQRMKIDASASALGQAAQKAAEAKDAYGELMKVGTTVASSLERAFDQFTKTGKFSFSDMVKSMLADMEKLAFRAALMPIFGGGTANSGGLLGSLLGNAFGGFRAEGGPVGSGSPYIVGEKGPELFVPRSAGTIVPNNAMSGGGGGGARDVNFTINLEGANGDETIARIASQAARQAVSAAVETSRSSMPAAQRRYQMLGA